MGDNIKDRIQESLDKQWSEWANSDPDADMDEDSIAFFQGRDGGFATVMWVPHKGQYEMGLSKISSDDIVCDMGAGNLAFAWRAAKKCKKVYAVEMCPETLMRGMEVINWKMPRNLIPICADWNHFPIPADTTVIICMVNIHYQELPKAWGENGIRLYHLPTWTKS